jgi:uncharacterized membrane protein YdjX (TVP38/TMEM64 family)
MGSRREKIFWFTLSVIIVIIFSLPILFSGYQEYVVGLIESSPYLAPLVIIVFRFLGVVLAPIPGAPIAFASMAVLPWQMAWLWNFIGAELGAMVAFLIARRFREPVVARFVSLEKIHQWQDKISQKKQFWGFVGLRFTALIAFDFISYAAGLAKLSFRTFLIATFLIDIPAGFIFFYFGGLAVGYSLSIFAVFIVMFFIATYVLCRRRKDDTL